MNINNPGDCFRFFRDDLKTGYFGDWLIELEPNGQIVQLIRLVDRSEDQIKTAIKAVKKAYVFTRLDPKFCLFDENDWLTISIIQHQSQHQEKIFIDYVKISSSGTMSLIKNAHSEIL